MTEPVGMAAIEQYMNYVEEKKQNLVDGPTSVSKKRLVVFQDMAGSKQIGVWEWNERSELDRIGALIGTFVKQFTGIHFTGYSCDLKVVAETAADQKMYHPEFAKLLELYNDSYNHRIEAKTIRILKVDTKEYIEKNKQQILSLVDLLKGTLSASDFDIEQEFGLKISGREEEEAVIDFTGDPENLQNFKELVKKKAARQWAQICCWPDLTDREIRFRQFCETEIFSVEDLIEIVEKSGRYARVPDEDTSIVEIESYRTPSVKDILGDTEKIKTILGNRFDSFCAAFEERLRDDRA